MLKEKESFRLLYQAIREIADKIGDNQLETNSVSLLLLTLILNMKYLMNCILRF